MLVIWRPSQPGQRRAAAATGVFIHSCSSPYVSFLFFDSILQIIPLLYFIYWLRGGAEGRGGVAVDDSYRRLAHHVASGDHGRPPGGPLETMGDHRGQFPRTDFGPGSGI